MVLGEGNDHSQEKPEIIVPRSKEDIDVILRHGRLPTPEERISSSSSPNEDDLDALLGIMALMRRHLVPLGSDSISEKEPDIYEDLHRQGETISAWSKLFFVTRWSENFLHGSDMTFAMTRFAEELLDEDERMIEVSRVEYRKLVSTQLQFFARVGAAPTIDDCYQTDRPAVIAEFGTSQGRKIHVHAYSTGMPISQSFHRLNPYVSSVAVFGEDVVNSVLVLDENELIFHIMAPSRPLDMDFCWRTHTAQDVVMNAMLILREAGYISEHGQTFAGGFSSFRPPEIDGMGESAVMRITIHHEKRQTTPKGFELLPMEVEFYDSSRQLIGGGVYTHIQPSSPEVSKQYAQQHPALQRKTIL